MNLPTASSFPLCLFLTATLYAPSLFIAICLRCTWVACSVWTADSRLLYWLLPLQIHTLCPFSLFLFQLRVPPVFFFFLICTPSFSSCFPRSFLDRGYSTYLLPHASSTSPTVSPFLLPFTIVLPATSLDFSAPSVQRCSNRQGHRSPFWRLRFRSPLSLPTMRAISITSSGSSNTSSSWSCRNKTGETRNTIGNIKHSFKAISKTISRARARARTRANSSSSSSSSSNINSHCNSRRRLQLHSKNRFRQAFRHSSLGSRAAKGSWSSNSRSD